MILSRKEARRRISAVNAALRAGAPPPGVSLGSRKPGAIRVAAGKLGVDPQSLRDSIATAERLYGLKPDWSLYKAPPPLGGRTPRHAMQALGTEWGRQLISSELWINAWAHASAHYLLQGLPVVVDDVRFANEAAAIWRRKGVLIRIDRAAATASAACAAHASENQALHYDARIENSGDEDAFRAVLDGLVRREVA